MVPVSDIGGVALQEYCTSAHETHGITCIQFYHILRVGKTRHNLYGWGVTRLLGIVLSFLIDKVLISQPSPRCRYGCTCLPWPKIWKCKQEQYGQVASPACHLEFGVKGKGVKPSLRRSVSKGGELVTILSANPRQCQGTSGWVRMI